MSEMLELNRLREWSTLQEAADYLQGFRNAFASGPWTKEFAEASDHLIQSFRNAFTAAPGTKEFAEADRQMQRLRNLFAFAAPGTKGLAEADRHMQSLRNLFAATATKDKVVHNAGRIPVTKQQNVAILQWLQTNNYDPLKLPVPANGKAGVKTVCRDALTQNSKKLFLSKSVFNTAWERLRTDKEIIDAK